MRFRSLILSLALASGAFASHEAFAWGDTGHRLVGEEAMRALPKGLPAFLYRVQSIKDVGQFSREPDIWRKAGAIHDAERDPAHLMRLDDTGLTLAGTDLGNMPATHSDYDAAVRAHGGDPIKAGHLYYSLSDAWAQVRKDFGVMRVIDLAIAKEKDKPKLADLKEALRRRQDLTLRDIGILSHYAGDATQPMHVSIHYDGWGDLPNPDGFTTEHVHWPVEGPYVHDHVTQAMVHDRVSPLTSCAGTQESCIAARLKRNWTQVVPLYKLEKTGAFKPDSNVGAEYLATLLGRGASDLRDMVADAWTQSTDAVVNSAGVSVTDVTSGKVKDLYAVVMGDS
ncbi:hypothetical protein [Asticcacaulis solisilvae]|uniref:hypothetical protein n=1 Tax=Asticcacaulis solisilvae TaxID=1217274 RepID=UPI003FD8B970